MCPRDEGAGTAADWYSPGRTGNTICGSLIGHPHTAFEQQLFDIAVAEAEPRGEPHAVADDFGREAIVLVTLGSG